VVAADGVRVEKALKRLKSSRRNRRGTGSQRPRTTTLQLDHLEERCLLAAPTYGQLPLAFEPNVGQSGAGINYLATRPRRS
jgi:hypothetical protein